MKCPYRGEEMMRGYLMSSRDITFTIDNHSYKKIGRFGIE